MQKKESTIVITGASQRVGLALATHFCQAGYPVIASYRTYRDSIATLEAMGVLCVQADFYDDRQLSEFIDIVCAQSKSIRAIIHNASDWLTEKDLPDPLELMQQMMKIHVYAPYQINLACESLLQANKQVSDIVHITDYAATTGSEKRIAYCASKAALENMTLSFAAKLAPQVKVNAIAPSLLMFNDKDDDAYRQRGLKKSLLQIEPGAEEAVLCVDYLLASNYLTGRVLPLDGGRHLA